MKMDCRCFIINRGEKVSFNDFFGLEYGYMMGGLIPFLKSNLSAEEYRNLFTYEGTTEPKFTGGWINRFYYKNFDLTVSASFVLDQTVQEQPFYNPVQTSPGQNYSRRMSQIWSPDNTSGKYPRIMGTYTKGRRIGLISGSVCSIPVILTGNTTIGSRR